jgi:hypothetical protein
MGFRHLETSVHRIQQSRLLICPEGRLIVLRAIRVYKHHLNDLVQIVFWKPKM